MNRYIHLNPIKAKLVKSPEDYRWSSYRAYFSQKEHFLISTSQILSYFPEPPLKHYVEYINTISPISSSTLKIEEFL